jgi:hypothetical protein
VQYWYYPGEKIGKEFIYPKDQAMRIAQRTGATVQTEEGPVTATAQAEATVAPAETAPATVSADAERPEAQAETTVATSDTSVATSDTSETEAVGTSGSGDQVASGSGVRQESTIAQADTQESGAVSELPATASPLALSGLLALLSLAGAAGIRSFRL